MVSKYWSHTQMHVHVHTHGCRSKSEEKGGFRVFAFVERSKSVIGSLIITGLWVQSLPETPASDQPLHSQHFPFKTLSLCLPQPAQHHMHQPPNTSSRCIKSTSYFITIHDPFSSAALHSCSISSHGIISWADASSLPSCEKKHSRVKMRFLIRKLQNVSYLLLLICS